MNGHITLPVLLEMKKTRFSKQIVELSHLTNKHQFDPLIDQIKNSNSITQSQEVSDHYLNKALDLIDQLEEQILKIYLESLLKECVLEIHKNRKKLKAL